jgi:hypothetical protein
LLSSSTPWLSGEQSTLYFYTNWEWEEDQNDFSKRESIREQLSQDSNALFGAFALLAVMLEGAEEEENTLFRLKKVRLLYLISCAGFSWHALRSEKLTLIKCNQKWTGVASHPNNKSLFGGGCDVKLILWERWPRKKRLRCNTNFLFRRYTLTPPTPLVKGGARKYL